MRVLVTGWFSFLHGEATAGDLLAMEVTTGWLADAGVAYDVACSPVLGGGVDLDRVDPGTYTDLLFVCGPARGDQVDDLRRRFAHARTTFLDVSLPDGDGSEADLVVERDSSRGARPDLAVAADVDAVPFVAVVRGHAQPEYGSRDGNDAALDVIDRLLERHVLATVDVDTRIDPRNPEARDPAQVEGRIARADAVVTSRLHGLVFAVKHGVPVVAIDPVRGGGKVTAQARALGWPVVLGVDEADDDAVDAALERCLRPASRDLAAECAQRARDAVEGIGREVIAALTAAAPTHR